MRLPYRIVRPLARIALKIYFKHIYLTGIENLPKNKPFILAANHPTAFLEPCLLACLLPTPLYFMVRGDFFQKKTHRKMLESLHMIPMYRLKDIGIKGVKNNFSSLEVAHDLLHDNKPILILAEGTTKHEKRLRPIRKGTARMALGAMNKYPSIDLQIIPIGVNYADVLRFRSFVMLDIGAPMAVSDYLQDGNQHPAKTTNKITKDLKKRLEERVIHIAEESDELLVERMFELVRNEKTSPIFPIQVVDRQPLEKEMYMAQKINNLPLESKKQLFEQVHHYFQKLDFYKVQDDVVRANRTNTIGEYALLAIGFIPYTLGYVFNFLPLYFGKWWSDNKVKEIVFVASIKASFSLAAYLLYIFILLIMGIIIQRLWFWVFILSIPILGYYALLFHDFKYCFKERRKWGKLSDKPKKELITERHTLYKHIFNS